jgi:hypothetical protein
VAFDWKGTIGKVAPWIATALGGPAAGLAIDAVCKAAGLAPSLENAQKAAEMAAAGSLTGEQFLALRQSEDAFKVKMAEMGYKQITDLEEISYKDRDSARNREIQTKDSWTPRLLAAFVVVCWFAISFYLVNHSILKPGASSSLDSNMEPMLMRLLGTLDAALTFVLSYYFGSSASSAHKDSTIDAAINKDAK